MMRRGLQVALRLAHIEARRALQELGAARSRSAALEERLAQLEAERAGARARLALGGAGGRASAADLQQHCAQLAGVKSVARAVMAQLAAARTDEESARRVLTERRLRVRVVSGAIARRDARERVHARRREARRVDEAVRASRALQRVEESHALRGGGGAGDALA
jgi:flagellar export protein FliJ